MVAYYNENNPDAAEWLRNLIRDGLIAPGDVDERSIVDVKADDVVGYRQCHWFAGVSGWSLALRLAGVPDSFRVWTGSAPCQPWSCTGEGLGTADPRHLWPDFLRLIIQCRPAVVVGEQVESRLGRQWLSGVRADLESVAYGMGGADLCAAGVGSTCIRQRLYWGAVAVEYVRNSVHQGLEGHSWDGDGCEEPRWLDSIPRGPVPATDVWSDFVVGRFRGDKWRRVESGIKPLVYGLPEGMGRGQPELRRLLRSAGKNRKTRLMAYGNAICPQVAAVFIRSFLESVTEMR